MLALHDITETLNEVYNADGMTRSQLRPPRFGGADRQSRQGSAVRAVRRQAMKSLSGKLLETITSRLVAKFNLSK